LEYNLIQRATLAEINIKRKGVLLGFECFTENQIKIFLAFWKKLPFEFSAPVFFLSNL